ncbi:MAG: cytochrome c-type biogenesis protein [Candidatus Roseilinea sp.]|uniref:cytochrome c-type biogenesis protein n=1 Tax=Candidatus Roseilinea sp. TaxID=2838777 RepID=UPI00404A15CC
MKNALNCNRNGVRLLRLLVLILALGLWLASAGGLFGVAVAQSPDPLLDDRIHDLAKQMNCPTCAGRNLADCPTDTCAQWKAEIRSQLEAGKSPDEVLTYFQTRFGPTVMQEPPREGALLLVWIAPVAAAIALVSAGVWAAHRASARKSPSATQPDIQSEDPYVLALEEQVRQS